MLRNSLSNLLLRDVAIDISMDGLETLGQTYQQQLCMMAMWHFEIQQWYASTPVARRQYWERTVPLSVGSAEAPNESLWNMVLAFPHKSFPLLAQEEQLPAASVQWTGLVMEFRKAHSCSKMGTYTPTLSPTCQIGFTSFVWGDFLPNVRFLPYLQVPYPS